MTWSPSSGSGNSLGPYVLALDVGTTTCKALAFAASNAEVVTYHQVSLESVSPREGWVEQDPEEYVRGVRKCIQVVTANLKKLDLDPAEIACVGLSNQRETTIIWDKTTGRPLYNAMLWLDTRTQENVRSILSRLPKNQNQNYLQRQCGLPITTYFSALKLQWLLENVAAAKAALREDRLLFGTVDSWLIWTLTGGPEGGRHVTDVTNASRTLLMNIETLEWDPFLCSFFKVPMSILPRIVSSSEIYGRLSAGELLHVPISGCLGDQQAALLGQGCLRPGQAKHSYGMGCFMLYNVGPGLLFSEHGLLTTVAYKLGRDKPAVYALEGSVSVGGAAIQWLHKNLGIARSLDEVEELASRVDNAADTYFVPAFSGLYAPHWRTDARGVICGLSQNSNREHICRAALEAIAFRTREIVQAMEADSGLGLATLLVDGDVSSMDLLMQIQADILGIPVVRPSMPDTAALGAALAAGCAEGVNVWDVSVLGGSVTTDRFVPRITEEAQLVKFERWKMAVERSLDWIKPGDEELINPASHQVTSRRTKALYDSIPGAVFMFTSFIMWVASEHIKLDI